MISRLNDIVEKDLYELIEVFMMNLFLAAQRLHKVYSYL